jgi:hypothetical protein
MKSTFLSLLSFFAISTFAFNQTFSITNQTSIGTYMSDGVGLKTLLLNDGSFLSSMTTDAGISGDKTIASYGAWDSWLFKTNSSNQVIWEKVIGGPGYESVNEIAVDSDGFIYSFGVNDSMVGGNVSVYSNGSFDYFLTKLTPDGTIVWQKNFGGNGGEDASKISILGDTLILLSGQSLSGIGFDKTEPNYGWKDAWVVAIDSSGNLNWEKSLGGSEFEYVSNVIYNPIHNSVLVCINTDSPISGNKTVDTYGYDDIWLVELDLYGTILQQKSFGGTLSDYVRDISLNFTNDGFFVLGWSNSEPSGNKTSINYGNNDLWLFEIDENFNIINDESYGGSYIDGANGLIKRTNAELVVFGGSLSGISGVKTEASYGNSDDWILGIDENLNLKWQKSIGGSNGDSPITIYETSHNEFKIFSYSQSPISGNKTVGTKGNEDLWIFDLSTTASVTSIVDNPISYYPNPVSNLLFFNSVEDHSIVCIYNQMGQLVLKTEVINSSIETNLLSSGIYMIQVETEFGTFTEKIIKE